MLLHDGAAAGVCVCERAASRSSGGLAGGGQCCWLAGMRLGERHRTVPQRSKRFHKYVCCWCLVCVWPRNVPDVAAVGACERVCALFFYSFTWAVASGL